VMISIPDTREPVPDLGSAHVGEAEVVEPPSFEQYVAARGAGLLRFANLLTGDPHRAEDLVQDALAKACLRWQTIGQISDPDVYLRRMLINGSHSWWRRRTNRELPVEGTTDWAVVGDFATETAERDEMWRLIAGLPHRQRAVLVLRYYEDLDDATIGEILSCTPGTVRTHAMRALNALRGHFGAARPVPSRPRSR
jgi:RNA polymerase sigma-70 factor (sigma-E family)